MPRAFLPSDDEVADPSRTGELLAVCRVHALLETSGSVGVTAIDKRPVEGPVKVRRLGLYADIQADRANHGGDEQAVYAYGQDDADWWAGELRREIGPGLFGENLRVRGIPVSGAVVGERWSIGTAELEVTQPRTPCATFATRMDEDKWVKRFTAANRTGAYLRVVRVGEIRAGDAVEVTYRPVHGVTIADWFGAVTGRGAGQGAGQGAARGVGQGAARGVGQGTDPARATDIAERLLAGEAADEFRLSDEMREGAERLAGRSA